MQQQIGGLLKPDELSHQGIHPASKARTETACPLSLRMTTSLSSSGFRFSCQSVSLTRGVHSGIGRRFCYSHRQENHALLGLQCGFVRQKLLPAVCVYGIIRSKQQHSFKAGLRGNSGFWNHFLVERSTRAFYIHLQTRAHELHLRASKQYTIHAMAETGSPKPKRIDAHLHVWAFPPEEGNPFPFLSEPPLPGNAPLLLKSMAEAGVDGALIVQSSAHKFDHSYVSRYGTEKYPGKFVGCCLADPTDGGGGVKELERLISEDGYKAVRFNPQLWPSGQKMTNDIGKLMFSKAGELGAVVGFMCFHGLLLSIDEIEELCLEFPATKIMLDHYGFCKPPQNDDESRAWKRLLALAQYPQVYVKISAHFRVSREPYPYKDAWPLFQELLQVFGSQRLLWGSDFPFVTAECGYSSANAELPLLIAKDLKISELDLENVLGGTALTLFKGGWEGLSEAM